MFSHNQRLLRRSLASVAAVAGANLLYRYNDSVSGTDRFAQHTNEQHKRRFVTGMHQPFMPNGDQYNKFMSLFPEFNHMLPRDLDHFQSRRVIHTPVGFKPLSDCPNSANLTNTDFTKVLNSFAFIYASLFRYMMFILLCFPMLCNNRPRRSLLAAHLPLSRAWTREISHILMMHARFLSQMALLFI